MHSLSSGLRFSYAISLFSSRQLFTRAFHCISHSSLSRAIISQKCKIDSPSWGEVKEDQSKRKLVVGLSFGWWNGRFVSPETLSFVGLHWFFFTACVQMIRKKSWLLHKHTHTHRQCTNTRSQQSLQIDRISIIPNFSAGFFPPRLFTRSRVSPPRDHNAIVIYFPRRRTRTSHSTSPYSYNLYRRDEAKSNGYMRAWLEFSLRSIAPEVKGELEWSRPPAEI